MNGHSCRGDVFWLSTFFVYFDVLQYNFFDIAITAVKPNVLG